MASTTPNLGLMADTSGHVELQLAVKRNAEILDDKVGPLEALSALAAGLQSGDIGKVIGVVDAGDGVPALGLISLAE